MAISATLQIGESGGGLGAFLAKNLKDIYTVLALDYTIERSCDKTGRPSGGASISFIKVTIRAAKQMGAPFHAWINGDDTLMDGVIKIYDSSGLLFSSTLQDAAGINSLVDLDDAMSLPEEMMETEMNRSMDDASKYKNREHDLYDEMSHADLLEQAKENKITVMAGDSDDVIKDKLRMINKEYSDLANEKDTKALEKFMEDHEDIDWPKKDEAVGEMTLEQLKKYAKDNGLGELKQEDDESNEDFFKRCMEIVKSHMELVAARELVKERPDKVKKAVEADVEKEYKYNNTVLAPSYKMAEEKKKQTTSTAKGIAKEVVKRTLECARSITFENAYCVSLKEHFTNKPDFSGKLDSTYPWTLEIGFKPKKVTVTGEQFGPTAVGGQVDFTLF